MQRFVAVIAGLFACCTVSAQDSHAVYQTPQGEVRVNSSQPATREFGPPPAFELLDSGHRGSIGPTEADAYPPLANDFIHADANRDGRVSRAEYERWRAKR